MTTATPVVIRQSSIEKATLCPAKCDPALLMQVEPIVPSSAMSFGTSVHASVEAILLGEPLASALTPTAIFDRWVAVAMEADGIDLSSYITDELVREVATACWQWIEEVEPKIVRADILGVEQRVEMQIGELPSGAPILLQGTPDLAMRGGILHDWKTTGRAWKEAKAVQRIQGPLYTVLADHYYGQTFVRMVYWVWDRAKQAWTSFTQYVTPTVKEAALASARKWAEMFEAGIYPPTPQGDGKYVARGWWCSSRYCDVWSVCPYKGFIPDGKANEIQEPVSW